MHYMSCCSGALLCRTDQKLQGLSLPLKQYMFVRPVVQGAQDMHSIRINPAGRRYVVFQTELPVSWAVVRASGILEGLISLKNYPHPLDDSPKWTLCRGM